jgi:hypothetical protein
MEGADGKRYHNIGVYDKQCRQVSMAAAGAPP